MMDWMAWTLPTALFFIAIGVGLAVMTLAELRWPTVARKGWLPMRTTRGDRFFISLLSAAWVHIGWLAATDAPVWMASLFAAVLAAVILRKA